MCLASKLLKQTQLQLLQSLLDRVFKNMPPQLVNIEDEIYRGYTSNIVTIFSLLSETL